MPDKKKNRKPIILTSHPHRDDRVSPIHWGHKDPKVRGPLIAGTGQLGGRNVIGTYSGSYMVYRALAVASGQLDPEHKPDLTHTAPTGSIGPFPSWSDPACIVSIDPFGALVNEAFGELIASGQDIRPTIAITKAQIEIPEIFSLMKKGELKADGKILKENGRVSVTKAAIEPVWYLPGIAARFKIEEADLRRNLFEQTAGMYPELVTRSDLKVFLPPIGGISVYLLGDVEKLGQKSTQIACRVHDECNGSDVFGSDICTCRPYLIHGIEVCIRRAQEDGMGVIVYNRKEGRALGEVTKFLVYNARKRQEGGDTAEQYFYRTECVAGVQDMRFQELMPDVLHWLGITKIDEFVSMSDMKHDAITHHGIKILKRISIPKDRIPEDAKVEMDAKIAAGYYSESKAPSASDLKKTKGRSLDD